MARTLDDRSEVFQGFLHFLKALVGSQLRLLESLKVTIHQSSQNLMLSSQRYSIIKVTTNQYRCSQFHIVHVWPVDYILLDARIVFVVHITHVIIFYCQMCKGDLECVFFVYMYF